MRSLVISLCCSAQEVAACWGKAKGTKSWDWGRCVFLLFRAVHEGKHLAQLTDTAVPLLFCEHVVLWGWWQAILWAAAPVQWSGFHPRAVTIFVGLWCSPPPRITQNPLSAQPHHLMQSQLRSSGLSPGNWQCLNLQRICRIIKFFQSFPGLVLVISFFLFRLSEAHEMNQLVCALFQSRTGLELDKTLQDLLLLCPWIVPWFSSQSCLNVGIKVGFLKSQVSKTPYFGDLTATEVQPGVI